MLNYAGEPRWSYESRAGLLTFVLKKTNEEQEQISKSGLQSLASRPPLTAHFPREKCCVSTIKNEEHWRGRCPCARSTRLCGTP
eukprot:4369496-Prymnesium_polylepis.1